jgi:hypothetical protein
LGVGHGGQPLEGRASESASENGRAVEVANPEIQPFGGVFDGILQTGQENAAPAAAAQSRGAKYKEWPVLREGDGDRAVHSLQVRIFRAESKPAEIHAL